MITRKCVSCLLVLCRAKLITGSSASCCCEVGEAHHVILREWARNLRELTFYRDSVVVGSGEARSFSWFLVLEFVIIAHFAVFYNQYKLQELNVELGEFKSGFISFV